MVETRRGMLGGIGGGCSSVAQAYHVAEADWRRTSARCWPAATAAADRRVVAFS